MVCNSEIGFAVKMGFLGRFSCNKQHLLINLLSLDLAILSNVAVRMFLRIVYSNAHCLNYVAAWRPKFFNAL